jgi:polyhydroxybutyrate depolymerase
LYVPSAYATGTRAVPLVIDMHGYALTAEWQQSVSGWSELSRTQGFIVAYPQGLNNAWNAQGYCCGIKVENDVQFLRTVVADIRSHGHIVPTRIYATGLSNGGSMSHRLACEAADLFAGIAPVSYPLSGGTNINDVVMNCTPSRGIPVMHFHGRDDATVPYDHATSDRLSAPDSRIAWSQILSCAPAVTSNSPTAGVTCEVNSGCYDGAKTALCSIDRGQHNVYGIVGTPGIPGIAWEFFNSLVP